MKPYQYALYAVGFLGLGALFAIEGMSWFAMACGFFVGVDVSSLLDSPARK